MGDGAVRLGAGEGRTPAQPDAKTDGIRTAKIQHRDQAVLILFRRNLEYQVATEKTETFSIGPHADLIVAWPSAIPVSPLYGEASIWLVSLGYYALHLPKYFTLSAVIKHQSATGHIIN
jgi:hypothetical protein